MRAIGKCREVLVLVAVLGLVAMASGCAGEPLVVSEPLAGQLVPAAAEHVNRISVSGTVESVSSRNVYTTLGFFVDRVIVEVGDRVDEGQILAILDTGDLELMLAQARAQLETSRQGAQVNIESSQAMLYQASANVRNNTNMHVVSAQAALAAADANISTIRASLEAAQEDSYDGSNAIVLAAQSALRAAELALNNSELDFENAQILYEIGGISQLELRHAEDALTMARNGLSDAQAGLDTASASQERTIEQLQISLRSATTARQQALNALNAARNAANQEVDLLRSNLEAAEVAANLEAHEIAIQIMERQLEDAIIRAPVSGTVTQVITREGMIGAGLLFVVENTDDLKVMTRFREYDIGLLSEGMEVTISSEAAGIGTYDGIITRINPAAVNNMGMSGSIVEFEAEVTVISESPALRIGMNVRLNIAV